MVSPIRFENIEKALSVSPGTMTGWVVKGCPTAGAGVAFLESVKEWLAAQDRSASLAAEPAAVPAAEPAAAVVTEVDESGIEWLTIRVPIRRNAPNIPGTNPAMSFRLSSSERHIRTAWSALHHGCRESHVTMANGHHVDKVSHSLKYILEQVHIAMAGK